MKVKDLKNKSTNYGRIYYRLRYLMSTDFDARYYETDELELSDVLDMYSDEDLLAIPKFGIKSLELLKKLA